MTTDRQRLIDFGRRIVAENADTITSMFTPDETFDVEIAADWLIANPDSHGDTNDGLISDPDEARIFALFVEDGPWWTA